MADHAAVFPVRLMARVLRVSCSGYYASRHRPPSARAERDADLTTQIAVVHRVSRGTYGAPRVQEALQQAGERVSRKRVARLMYAATLVGKTSRRWRASSPSDPTAATPNVLARDFAPSTALNARWGADITYLHYDGGTAYLAVVQDLASRAIVGWALAPHLLTTLPAAALRRALLRPRLGRVLHHSDRGVQYVSAPLPGPARRARDHPESQRGRQLL
ncbi:putative transposase orfB for insertion sequence element [Gemmatimonas aurantiaca T-27]|nr:IS3 family transposase [Gemmatimonas aurantiaca]BAH39939.1 putative transposase orfB for insertion sequence element [Gemmatimonas aurantiaca T-27]